MPKIDWFGHAQLHHLGDQKKRCIASGELQAVVAVALTLAGEMEQLVIQTDAGQMFCRHEIGYIGMLADRPLGH